MKSIMLPALELETKWKKSKTRKNKQNKAKLCSTKLNKYNYFLHINVNNEDDGDKRNREVPFLFGVLKFQKNCRKFLEIKSIFKH